MDLAEAHLAALGVLDRGGPVGAVNLGSGRGATVREVLAEVERVVCRPVPREVGPRRAGDPPRLVASVDLAAEKLGWRSRRGLAEVVEDALRSRKL
jgi:UDP-glucose 4-epimerase